MEPASSQDFYTWSALGTLAGASGAVIVVSNTVRKLAKWDSPWAPFICSLLVVLGGGFQSGALSSFGDYALAALNACLLFCTATGINQAMLELKPVPEGEMRPYGRRQVPWLSPWLKSR